ncbi:MAG: enoyl-CoA hydratase/isomerase family protein, partial [Sphingomonadales bacterium]|nr:enoyl-CoA hydratase/isomerase family protein [Sphingomonadales bacterium]
MSKAINIAIDDDGIATLSIDVAGESMNVINENFLDDLEAHVKTISEDENIKGAIITSAKPAFMAGADLRMLGRMIGDNKNPDMAEVYGACYRMNKVLRAMET